MMGAAGRAIASSRRVPDGAPCGTCGAHRSTVHRPARRRARRSESAQPIDTGYQSLRLEREGAIDWLSLHRPDRLNATDGRMCDELQDYFGALSTRHATRVVILRGAGRAFCAGFDLKAAHAVTAGPVRGLRAQRHVSEIILRIRRCPQPIICLVHGAATGGGLALALAADVRIAAPSARMNVAMVRVGLTGCDVGISYFLPRAVGSSVAAELMLTGRFIEADRALRVGLVSDVVPEDQLAPTGRALAQEMLATSPLGLRLTKDGLNFSLAAGSLEAAIAIEDRGQILAASAGYFAERIAAFREPRPPVFRDDCPAISSRPVCRSGPATDLDREPGSS